MTERIINAMDYHLDAFTKALPKQFKQRMLGDIDGKYSIIDPLLDVSYQLLNNTSRQSEDRNENKIIPQALAGTVFRGIEEDLERLIRTPERNRSSTAPLKTSRPTIPSRPATSASQTSGRSSGIRRQLGSLPKSRSKYTPQASIKRLAFTSPTIKVGSMDVRDEVTDEIVNKPMTMRWGNLKSQSAPPTGRTRSCGPRSATKSAKWTSVSSSKRARTSYSRRRRNRLKSSEKIPGPFMTVKVSEKDLWVVSNSTPTTFFTDITNTEELARNGSKNVKVISWEDAADSVPKAEQASPPRFERTLGAPAQFAPTINWLRYDHSAPPKKPPILTPFKDGKYYHLETNQRKSVNRHINASPGVRVARNGEVLSHSLKLENTENGDESSEKDSDTDSEADISSLIPVKLAAKIKRHYGTPDNESDCDDGVSSASESEVDLHIKSPDENEDAHEKASDSKEPDSSRIHADTITSSDDPIRIDEDEAETSNRQSNSEASSMSDAEGSESSDREKPTLTKRRVELLERITRHAQGDPFADGSEHTSTTSYDSHELENYLRSQGVETDFYTKNGDIGEDSDVWRVLEDVNPTFWVSYSRHKKLSVLRRLKKGDESGKKNEALLPSSASTRTKEDSSKEVIVPLCWEDELTKADKIVKGREGTANALQKCDSSALPVVYNHGKRNFLPSATLNSSFKYPIVLDKRKSARSAHSVNFSIDSARGYKPPMSTPRSVRSDRTQSADNSRQTSASSSRGRKIMDLADLLQVTPDSFPSMIVPARTLTHRISRDRVIIVRENGVEDNAARSETENQIVPSSESQRKQSAEMTATESADEGTKQPIESLDFTRLDVDSAGESILHSSQRFTDLKSSDLTSPYNTPTTPYIQAQLANGTAPRTSLTGLITDTKCSGDKDDGAGETHPQAATWSSRPISVFVYDDAKGSPNQLGVKPPNRSSLNASEHVENRPKTSRAPLLHHNGIGPKTAKSPYKLSVPAPSENPDTSLTVPSLQLRAPNSPTATAMKTADFIQITQSLQIRDRPVMESDRSSLTGNKMYDSYMHELAAQSAEQRVDQIDEKGIVGRGLGGSSGKGGSLVLPRSVRKNLASCQPTPSLQSPNISPFTTQAGRRSGLTMVSQDGNRRPGPFGLGVKGDQVRLNIDKNIHNIYRDLGVLKSPGRSHLTSAKSHSSQKSDITVNVPSVPPSERETQAEATDATVSQDLTVDTQSTVRPSSAHPDISVQDSGTQWSSRSIKQDEEATMPHTAQRSSEQAIKESSSENHRDPQSNGLDTEERAALESSQPPPNTPNTTERSLKGHKLDNDKFTEVDNGHAGVTDEELSDDDVDVRGVTRVTVNM